MNLLPRKRPRRVATLLALSVAATSLPGPSFAQERERPQRQPVGSDTVVTRPRSTYPAGAAHRFFAMAPRPV